MILTTLDFIIKDLANHLEAHKSIRGYCQIF
jgi:hypothetical protein